MFRSLEGLLSRYTRRISSGSDAALILIEKEWPLVAQEHNINIHTVYPLSSKDHVLTLSCASSEEAAHLRLLKSNVMRSLNEKLKGYAVGDIRFSQHERT